VATASEAVRFRYGLMAALMMANFIAVTFEGLPAAPES
jgi:hypothetical protein